MKCYSFLIFLFVLSTSSLILAKEDGKRRQGLAYFPSNTSTRLKFKDIIGFPDTLRIVAIRVEFIEDVSDLTTGNGRFDLSGFPSPNSDELIFDPPPHNKLYFEDHLTALKNYYFSISKGNLVLQSMVYPDASVESYQLPQQMDYYNPNTTDEILDQRLAELMRDAFVAADNQDNIDFSQFDVFMVFHAGVGKDIAFDLDPTPKDIPSVFLNLSDFRKNLGNGDPSFQGIPVNNNTFFIPEGIILPETENQEGIQFGLNGTVALMVGFQLGLPNLFNTDTGESGIGAFGLMDQGSGNFFGLLPAQPCAWSKVYMGWEIPVILREGISIEVATALAKNGQRIIKVPISAKEYFLIENRQRDINDDNLAIGKDDTRGVDIWFNNDGSVIASGQFGVITQVDEYDFGIPGSGILIWHIDERVIEEKINTNRVNADPKRRGVDLEEADGSQDIGLEVGIFGDIDIGTPLDLFYQDNTAPLYKNQFTSASVPNSLSNDRSDSHISITNISKNDTVMTFDLSNDYLQKGYPDDATRGGALTIGYTSRFSPRFLDTDGDGSADGYVISSSDQFIVKILSGDELNITTADSIPIPYTLIDLDNVAGDDLVYGSSTGEIRKVYVRNDSLVNIFSSDIIYKTDIIAPITHISVRDSIIAFSNTVNELYIVNLDSTLNAKYQYPASIVGVSNYSEDFLVVTEDGKVYSVSNEESLEVYDLKSDIRGAVAVGFFDGDQSLDWVIAGINGRVGFCINNGRDSFSIETGSKFYSSPALGDIDGDGFLEVVMTGENRVYAFNHNGSSVTNFPIIVDRTQNIGIIESSPVLGDVDGDGDIEIIFGKPNGQIVGYHHDGRMIDGFPLSTGGRIRSTPNLLDLDNDGDIEIAATSDDGSLYVWDLPGVYLEDRIPWGSYLHDVHHSGMNLNLPDPVVPTGIVMPERSVYNYPNPAPNPDNPDPRLSHATAIRYSLNYPSSVNVRIYDLSGELVQTLPTLSTPQGVHEIIWDIRDIESGIYLARVEAQSAGRPKSMAIIKIAIVK